MARPRQKKKNRSSRPLIRQKPKSKHMNIKSNPIIAANWNSKLTLSQNYRNLGLSSKLNSFTGGTESNAVNPDTNDRARGGSLAINPSRAIVDKGIGTVKVVRDENGNITGVVRDDEERRSRNPLGDPLNDIFDDEEGEDEEMQDAGGRKKNSVLAQLEESSRCAKMAKPRKMGEREKEWIGRLVERWGDNFEGMSRDGKGNPMQYSPGEMRKRVKAWKQHRRDNEEIAGAS